jgi:hypothetical protein
MLATIARNPYIPSAAVTSRLSLVAIAGAALALLALSACRDPVNLIAARDTVTDTLSVYALTGTPLEYPTALITPAHTVVRAESSLEFDVAFDINAQGHAVLYPFKLVIDPTAARRIVGIQAVNVPFDSLKRAPATGYRYDSATVAPKGTVLAIQASRDIECQFDITRIVYSKIVIDDIDLTNRRIDFRILVDPACGFRDLVPGRPRR